MLKNSIYCLFIITFFLLACFIIYNNLKISQTTKDYSLNIKYILHYQKESTTDNKITDIKNKEETIGKLTIKKLFLEKDLYDINNIKNNVEENVTILKGSISPDKDNSIMFLAAHSGTGKQAFFKNLNLLEKNDVVELIYKEKKYLYIVENKWETKKDGNIEVPKYNKKQLILTTCSPNNEDKQLIINCTIKES